MLFAITDFVGRIVTFFEPNAIDDFFKIFAWLGAIFH